jgi:hypothetical protein
MGAAHPHRVRMGLGGLVDQNITVSKTDLLATLRDNRDEHASDYAEGIAEYQRQASERLQALARKVTEDPDADLYSVGRELPKPENHTDDYDTAIKMLEWHQGDSIELGIDDFQHYVLDQWRWKEAFASSMSNYSAKFSARR